MRVSLQRDVAALDSNTAEAVSEAVKTVRQSSFAPHDWSSAALCPLHRR